MPQTKILLDSNSYFRLARSIHPLLFVEFGEPKFCLYVLDALDAEFSRSPRLQSKFSWVTEAQYVENRQQRLTLSRAGAREVEALAVSVRDYAFDVERSLSRVDAEAIAVCRVLGIELVTDDVEAAQTATDLGVKTLTTLELLHRAVGCGHVTLEKVREVVAYWRYDDDCPAECGQEYERLFKEKPPF